MHREKSLLSLLRGGSVRVLLKAVPQARARRPGSAAGGHYDPRSCESRKQYEKCCSGVIGDGDQESRAESVSLRSGREDPGDSVSRGPAQALSNRLQETVMAAFHFWNFRTYVEQTMSESGTCDSSDELVSDLLMGFRSRRSLRLARAKPIASVTSVADGGVAADYTFVFLAGRPRLTGATATAFWRGAAFSRS
jgi:hypothetical protein